MSKVIVAIVLILLGVLFGVLGMCCCTISKDHKEEVPNDNEGNAVEDFERVSWRPVEEQSWEDG